MLPKNTDSVEYTRKFHFGKIDYFHTGRKINAIELSVRVVKSPSQNPTKYQFSVMGLVWNNLHTDCVLGGQCLDDINERVQELHHQRLWREIYSLWGCYHLSSLQIKDAPEGVIKRIDLLLEARDEADWYELANDKPYA